MSGIHNIILAGGAPILSLVVTTGVNAGGSTGYSTAASGLGAAGSVTSGTAILRTKNIQRILSRDVTIDFQIELDTVVAQSFFTGVRVMKWDGSYSTFLTAAATFSTGSDTIWQWGSGSGATIVWRSADAPQAGRVVEFF